MKTTKETPNQSLTRALVGATLVSVFLGMLVYTGIEYLFRSPVHFTEFFTHHFLPASLIGVIVSITVVLLLERNVVAPIRQIFEHLYHVGSGRLTPLHLDSKIDEINTVVSGINLLVERLKLAPNDKAFVKALMDVSKLREDLESTMSATGSEADNFIPIMRDLRELEGDLLSMGETAVQSA